MTLDRAVEETIAREIETLGYELLKIEASFQGRRGTLRVFIDRADGVVTIDDCVRVTKSLGLALDAVETLAGPYRLEISSPGSYRPLTKPAHYERFVGELARVAYVDESGKRTTVTGTISGANDEAVTVRCNDDEWTIQYERIVRANLQPDDGSREEPRRPRRSRRG